MNERAHTAIGRTLLEDLDFTQQQMKKQNECRYTGWSSEDTKALKAENLGVFHNDKQLSYLDVYVVISVYIVSLICRWNNALSK